MSSWHLRCFPFKFRLSDLLAPADAIVLSARCKLMLLNSARSGGPS